MARESRFRRGITVGIASTAVFAGVLGVAAPAYATNDPQPITPPAITDLLDQLLLNKLGLEMLLYPDCIDLLVHEVLSGYGNGCTDL
jgi:hypothetical protein